MSGSILRSIVHYSTSYEDPMSVLRVGGFAQAANFPVIPGIAAGHIDVNKINEGDIVVLQRDYCRSIAVHQELIHRARALHKPVVFDLDDLLFDLPADHPDRINSTYADALLPMMLAVMDADLVTVSTPVLGDALRGFNPNIEVVPNYLVDSLWQFRDPSPSESSTAKINIGYMGGKSHLPDLQMILPALREISRRYEGRVSFHFWGISPPDELSHCSTVEFPSYRYADFASYFQEQKVDFFIAPLRNNLFNACKSAVKFLEYSTVGSAGVYSNMAPYAAVIENGKDGLLADSIDDWVHAIKFLIENPQARYEMALQAQEKVKKDWLLSNHAAEWARIHEKLLNSNMQRPLPKPPFYPLLNSIAVQTENLAAHHDPQLKALAEKVQEQNQLIDRLREEVAAYSGSTSWRVTKPLRLISTLLKKER